MKLLNKTIQYYFILSMVLLLVAIPVFYFVLRKIVIANIDADLVATKTQLIPRLRVMEIKPGDPNPLLNNDVTLEKSQGRGEASDSLYTSESHRLLSSYLVINQETYRLQIKSSIANHQKLIGSIIILQSVLLILLLAGLLLVNQGLARRIWKPFYQTLRKLRAYKVDDAAPLELGSSAVAEFRELNTAVEQLAERSRKAYVAQKEFAENASHEMRTPLAIFQGKLELLMQTDPLTEEQADLITDLATASQRMARLNRGLILLTRIQNGQFPETEEIDVKRTAEHLLDQYQAQIEQKNLQLEKDWLDDISLTINRTLLEVLLGNLLSNAIRHNIPGGRIVVKLANGAFTVRNTGQPYALPEDRIFERFTKSSADTDSMGLGLEIVNKICALYGFSIHYSYENQYHSFTVQMKS
ncbi:sensor histidine kinase [Chitinophaga barathri]|uniref:histidine kinase n=1 Tax=Chitinophaga barathri TaxID=1647451 RepID=A0A3N4MG73_9BACT|nr:HAMP domain-containing sensor histidine kinase [Chitinophaga barathri]RPD38659.1 sensor histidine kinase [Chitinophaga barathri]